MHWQPIKLLLLLLLLLKTSQNQPNREPKWDEGFGGVGHALEPNKLLDYYSKAAKNQPGPESQSVPMRVLEGLGMHWQPIKLLYYH